ncbi:MAG: glycoside hydrolase family 3 N-terminal domain-containing protein [Trebonia sp.]|uniref:glycoside hydrolase family 3 N-terminal domain-containing protein n=1 Tax=Trebonia sp. TaxID=2767075 RepID=UPI003BB13777
MGIPETAITRRGALAVGAGAVIGGLGLSRTAQAAPESKPVKLTPAQLAGQRVIFSYPGLTPPASLLDQISAGEAGGVIFFGENITSLSQIAAVVAQLNEAHAASPVRSPLLLMTDQEGGIVRRLPGEPVLSEKQIGESADPAAEAADAGAGAGENLAGVGMNLNLAPVLDVYRQAGNFDDEFGRSYSMDPNVCAECGAAFVTAQQKLGIAATAKHFPGLGAATVDQNTDLGPVTLDVPLADLRSIDERPFLAAIAASVRLVMTSWAVYPALDPELPSGLSPTIVGRELRQRLKFRGVTITDALEAGAIASFGTPAQCGVLAAQAGMDVLLASARDVSEGQDTVAALAEALQNHTLNPGHFDIALRRVLALRDSLA